MEVLVEDLCKPDVVAAIAKRRLFFIKDKPSLTPDIWERFRDCAPRPSEPPDSADSSRTPSPTPDDVSAEPHRIAAKEALDTLIQLGGRPTGRTDPIQSAMEARPPQRRALFPRRRPRGNNVLRSLFPVAEKRLEWAKQQLLTVLTECATSSEGRPISRRLIEERSELEAKRVLSNLVETGGKPNRPIRRLPENSEREHADQYVHALRHWEGEYSQFEEEWRVGKKFLDYWRKTEADDKTEAQPEGGLSAESTTQVELSKDYRAYQQLKVDIAKQWVEFWQRHVEENYDFEKVDMTRGWETVADRSQSFLDEARKQVRFQQMRLEWVEQQLSALLAASVVSTTGASPSDRLGHQSRMPKSASRSGQTSLKDLRYSRSDRLAPRSNHGEKNIRASAKFVLDPIHSSKVSKAKGSGFGDSPRSSRSMMIVKLNLATRQHRQFYRPTSFRAEATDYIIMKSGLMR
ncbi:MAG: hypothetical protein Q9185_005905 [Variospora sp. 1 TL-2023]